MLNKLKLRRAKRKSPKLNDDVDHEPENAGGIDSGLTTVEYLLPEDEVHRKLDDRSDTTDTSRPSSSTLFQRRHSAASVDALTSSRHHNTHALFCTNDHDRPPTPNGDALHSDDAIDGDVTNNGSGDDEVADDKGRGQRPTLDEMFCTYSSSSGSRLRLPGDSSDDDTPPQRQVSSADSIRKHMRASMSQMLQSTSCEMRRLRRRMKKNQVREQMNVSQIEYPRQSPVITADQSTSSHHQHDSDNRMWAQQPVIVIDVDEPPSVSTVWS